MPRFGRLDVNELAAKAPLIDSYAVELLSLRNTQVLNVTSEAP